MKFFCFIEQQDHILKTLNLLASLETLRGDEEFLARKSEIDIFLLLGPTSSSKLSLLQRFLVPHQTLVWVTSKSEFEKNISAIPLGTLYLDQSWEHSMIQSQFENWVRYQAHHKSNVMLLNRSMDPIIVQMEKELLRSKKIHEHLLPKRFSKIKGIDVAAKYDAGMSGGGEFFDIIKDNNYLLLLMSSCRSYLSSSLILQHFAMINQDKDLTIEGIDKFEKNVFADLKNSGLDPFKKEYSVNLLLFYLDLSKLHFEARVYGLYLMCGREKLINSGNYFEFCPEFSQQVQVRGSIGPGDRVVFLSPGLRRNVNDMLSNQEIYQFIPRLANKTAHDTVNDLLFEVHKKKNGEYLESDSSAIVMDIQGNKIYEI